MKKNARYELDLSNMPPLNFAQKIEIEGLKNMPDNEIDYSEIPSLDNSFLKKAVQNPFYKPHKKVTTIRLDMDILAWLKSHGKGYQTRINTILKEAMIKELNNQT